MNFLHQSTSRLSRWKSRGRRAQSHVKTFGFAIKRWLNKSHRIFVTLMVFAMSVYGISQSLIAYAAACTAPTGGDVVISVSCTLSVGTHDYSGGTLTINSGVIVTAGDDGSPGQVIIIADSIDVQGTITGTGLGFASSAGTGAGTDGAEGGGAGHGGAGGFDAGSNAAGGTTYGSVTTPATLGSGGGDDTNVGGGQGGEGGGAIKLSATSGTVTIGGSGSVIANGDAGTSDAGGGAGGSIHIHAATISGTGSVTATGGAGSSYGGGGGGGRISINYTTDSATWTQQAYGGANSGSSSFDGGAGTIFEDDTDDGDTNGYLTIDNGEKTVSSKTKQVAGTTETYDDITVKSGAAYQVPDTSTLALVSGGTLTGGGTVQASLTVDAGGIFDLPSTSFTFNDIDIIHRGSVGTINGAELSGITLTSSAYTYGSVTAGYDRNATSGLNEVSSVAFDPSEIDPGDAVIDTANDFGYFTVSDSPGKVVKFNLATMARVGVITLETGENLPRGITIDTTNDFLYVMTGTNPTEIIKIDLSDFTRTSSLVLNSGEDALNGGSMAIDIANQFLYVGTDTSPAKIVKVDLSDFTRDSVLTLNSEEDRANVSLIDTANGFLYVVTDTNHALITAKVVKITLSNFTRTSAVAVAVNSEYQSGVIDTTNDYIYLGSASYPNGFISRIDTSPFAAAGTLYLEDGESQLNSAVIDVAGDYAYFGSFGGGNDVVQITLSTFTRAAALEFVTAGTGIRSVIIDAADDIAYFGFGGATDSVVKMTGPATVSSEGTLESMIVGSGSTFTQEGRVTFNIGTFTVQSGGTATHAANTTAETNKLIINSATATDIQSGGTINISKLGYTVGNGPGTGSVSSQGGGGGYGGNGGRAHSGAAGGAGYGSLREPINIGSGGGNDGGTGSKGGGAVKLIAAGTITIDGTIKADGELVGTNQNGGGSGGSIWINAGTLDGDGTITANGGNPTETYFSSRGGGGGGGRIAVYYTTDNSSIVSGSKYQTSGGAKGSTSGGDLGDSGGAGTIYVDNGTGSGDLIIDGGNTAYTGDTSITLQKNGSFTFNNITVASGAKYSISTGETLTLSGTGTLTGGGTNQSSIIIDAGGIFNPNHTSFTFNDIDVENSGDVTTVTTLGVTSATFTNNGDVPSTTALTVTSGTFNHNASGDFGSGLTSLTLSTGTMNDNGGSNLNLSTLSVPSGSTYVLTEENYYPFVEAFTNLTIDGTFTSGRVATFFLNNLTVNNGGTVKHAANTTSKTAHLDISASSTITVNTGGTINVSSLGYTVGNGPGTGAVSSQGGGGGYGGNGGRAHSGATGGTAYGSLREPTDLGSGGGNDGGTGSKGGGAVKLVSAGTIIIDGSIKADGELVGTNQNGGGSGGSVWIDAGTLDGDGTITANGGNPTETYFSSRGGGGGGGRIAVHYTTDNSSIISDSKYQTSGGAKGSTSGGDLGDSGGAGTIYVDNGIGSGDLIVDSGNVAYTGATSLTPQNNVSFTFNNITVASGAKYSISSGETLTLSATGTLTGGGTNQASIIIDAGGTFNPNHTSFTINDIDVENSGDVTTTTNLGVTNATFTNNGDVPSATALTVTSGTFNHNAVGDFSTGVTSLTLSTGTMNDNGGSNLNLSTLSVPSGSTYILTEENYYPFAEAFTNLTIDGTFTSKRLATFYLNNLTVNSGGTLNHSANTTTKTAHIDISATGTVVVNSGGTIDVSERGYKAGAGAGAGGAGGGGGGGYGGVGGRSSAQDNGGPTYGSATAPTDLGSGGTEVSSGSGGNGGGAIKLSVAGTITIDGTIKANGDIPTSVSNGGGSGGSIWLAVDTYAGSGSISANGGDAVSGQFATSGGGGGGRIYITYTTKTYSGTTPTVTGGTKNSAGAADGAVGTFSDMLLSPTIDAVGHSPASPTVTDSVTLTSSASYASGLDRIEVYLDGTDPGNLKKTCDMASATSGNCNIVVGTLSGGSHTTTVKAFGDDATSTTDTDSFNVIVGTTSNVGTVGRSKINSATTFALSFTLTNTLSSDLTITFPASFTLTGAFTSGTCASGTIHTFAFDNDAHTLTASKTDCTGAVNLSGANITLPGTAGLYTVSWTNDDPGEVVIPVTDDDQVTVSADVAGEMTFDLDIGTSNVNNSAPYTLAIGELDTASANGSDDSTVSGIWIDLSTNATAGAVVQVKSVNAALKSASVPGDTIASSSGTVNAGGTERYGLCIATTGNGTVTASAGTLQSVAPFTGSGLGCTTTNSTVGALTTSFQTFLNSNSLPIDGGRTQVRLKVDISDTTPAHDDYADTLTFRATATF